jgi:hypothetical protein
MRRLLLRTPGDPPADKHAINDQQKDHFSKCRVRNRPSKSAVERGLDLLAGRIGPVAEVL